MSMSTRLPKNGQCRPPFWPSPGHENTFLHDRNKDARYFVVADGFGTGVFTDQANEQTDGYSNYVKRSVKTWDAAEEVWDSLCQELHGAGCPAIRIPAGFTAPTPVIRVPSSARPPPLQLRLQRPACPPRSPPPPRPTLPLGGSLPGSCVLVRRRAPCALRAVGAVIVPCSTIPPTLESTRSRPHVSLNTRVALVSRRALCARCHRALHAVKLKGGDVEQDVERAGELECGGGLRACELERGGLEKNPLQDYSSDDEVLPLHWAVEGLPNRFFLNHEAALNACHLSSLTQPSLMRSKDLAALDLFSSGRY
ncbi:hypothetical protein B0H13DRAFT_2379259 [Mycena leptocephala]|nr:hypothetical protein B0H13DRAFT_2379259 [Mycena leptocephala]